MLTRRQILNAAALSGGAAVFGSAISAPLAAAQLGPRAIVDPIEANNGRTSANTPAQPPGVPGRDYLPVFTPNGCALDYKIVGGVKVMHLVACEVQHEFAPGLTADCWGYNGHTPGPTIEAVEGDRLRIYVTNRLPEPTTIHWHGIRNLNGMDGDAGLTQKPIPPRQTFRYEFTLPGPGTFMYHSHFDTMTQDALGMMGMFIVHPRHRPANPPDRDYVIMLSEWRIDPGTRRPVTTEMTDFNLFTMNSKVYPATHPLVAKLGQRVRIRLGNLGAMDHHPIHLHGYQMTLIEQDGSPIAESARRAGNTFLVPVGSTRTVEFIADNPGDWPMHCHMTHHTMNQMGHNVPNLIGVNAPAIDKAVDPLLPDFMTMGSDGMGAMSAMSMPAPPNSIPMLGGKGRFGPIDMGGMFTLLKVRQELSGYDDPGDYDFPPGTVSVAATPGELARDGIDVNVRFENRD